MAVTASRATARLIRRRLFGLLLWAFSLTVAILVSILVVTAAYVSYGLATGAVTVRPPAAAALEDYYRERGTWEGVGTMVDPAQGGPFSLARQTLIDADGRIVVDEGALDSARIGQVWSRAVLELRIPLQVDGRVVGEIVLADPAPEMIRSVGRQMWVPVLVIIGLLTLLTLLIGYQLARRYVEPLADVMAGARAVAHGALSTRVPVHRQAGADLREFSDSFNHMAESLESNDLRRRELLADIAHELRTPLSILQGRLEGIVDGIYPAAPDQIAPALEEAYLLERLVEDLRTLTQAESGQLHFDRRPIQLAAIAERALSLFQPEAQSLGVELRKSVQADVGCVLADPQRIEQIVGNLVSNALRYATSGGQVELAVSQQDGDVEFAVRDTGLGVSEADLPRLFERLWRAERARTRATGGAGLGLAISKHLIQAQGGQIAARNRPTGGLEVVFHLPVHRSEDNDESRN
jgi:signal transduction histidine kinase